ELTVREYALLEFLMRNVGRVQTRSMLTEHVWGLSFDPESNVVDVYVGYLRRKVDGPGDRRLIHTIPGAGYGLRGWPCAPLRPRRLVPAALGPDASDTLVQRAPPGHPRRDGRSLLPRPRLESRPRRRRVDPGRRRGDARDRPGAHRVPDQ